SIRKNPVPEGAGFFALCAEKHAGWRLRLTRPTCFPSLKLSHLSLADSTLSPFLGIVSCLDV
ncbi:hypothetical protein, partial [Enterobacter hormaechei]|uniref:hypothetical protein n=1 Tax=Enterobacter hormaechei TaxID=158836 RepID=UPI001EDA01B2